MKNQTAGEAKPNRRTNNLALSHILTKMAELAYQQLKKDGEIVAQNHAYLFSYEFMYILEEPPLIWPTRASPILLLLRSDVYQGSSKGFSNKQMAT
jgi:hypothetical protein